MRTFDSAVVENATEQVRDDLKGLPVSVWMADLSNIALTNTEGDVALFEARQRGVYCGHYFFHSRGREAIAAAEAFLTEVFADYPVHCILGFTPTDKKGALWLSRRLGFMSHGDEEINGRMHRIFTMTRKDFDEQSARR